VIPAREVPHGLTADEYLKLSIQYFLMYWPKQAIISARKAAESGKGFKRGPLQDLDPTQMRQFGSVLELFEGTFEFQEQAGQTLRESLKALGEAAEIANKQIEEFEPFAEIKREIENVFNYFSKSATQFFGKTIEEVIYPALGLPTRDLPEGLAAWEYFELAQKYKALGWTEQSRDACMKVHEMEPNSELDSMAMRFLRTRVPRQPVPHAAVQRNIEGHNQLTAGDLVSAEKTFKALLLQYSDFEWPYGNLGLLRIRKGDVVGAKKVLEKALDLNGNYINAWLHLARAHAVCLELGDARVCVDKALSLDPDDSNGKALKEVINFLSAL
jgi:tetratricopeptide (TPR) repeat protein